MLWTYLRYPPLYNSQPETPASGSPAPPRAGLEASPYRASPSPAEERARDCDDDDEVSTIRVVTGITLFALLISLLRLTYSVLGDEGLTRDTILALIAIAVSGVYVVKVVALWWERYLRSS